MTVREQAYAKINLFLDVTGRREDGFHDILSIMHSVSLCDIITLSCVTADSTEITIVTDSPEIPTDQTNIVYRAVKEYLSFFDVEARVDIQIEKHIPVGAGLGGGSSDGAAALRAINNIMRLASREQLLNIGAKIGSDIPFCLVGGLCLCRGRGEEIEKMKGCFSDCFVIAIGESRISTPKAYAALDEKYNDFCNDDCDSRYLNRDELPGLAGKDDTYVLPYNIFEEVTDLQEIDEIKKIMANNGAEFAMMSGSGPSVFGKFMDFCDAERACHALIDGGYTAFVCHSVYPEEFI